MVEHYYAVAPSIAKRLVDPAMLDEVWEVVQSCVKAIELQEFEYATSEYVRVVLALQQRLKEKVA